MLKVASLNDILEAKEFNKWCKKNCSTLTSWFFSALYDTQIKLENEGLIIPGFDKNKRVKKVVSELLREEAIKLKGLKKFLLDFSTISDKGAIDVHLWEEYLIFAQLLGIAKKVEEQFSELYPEMVKYSKLSNDNITSTIRRFSHNGISEYERENRRRSRVSSRRYSGTSRSSGSGGRSFSSGGRSSGGSSGGGFR